MLHFGANDITCLPFEKILQYIHDLPKRFFITDRPARFSGSHRDSKPLEEELKEPRDEGLENNAFDISFAVDDPTKKGEREIVDVHLLLRETGVNSLLLEKLEREYQDSQKKAAKTF